MTLGRLRREIEPVTAAQFYNFLGRWQHTAPGTQLHGADGLLEIIRQLQGYEIPHALTANQPIEWNVPLRDHDHVFLKGHRIMVQIQSTWFPLIDRNPQKFVPSIYKASASDFMPATQRIYCSPKMPSHLVLSVIR